MLTTTLKSILGHKARLAMTAVAVVLGVALMSGTLVLTDTVGATFDDLVADIYRDTDSVVRSTATYENEWGETLHVPVDGAVLDEVAATPGVRTAEGVVQGYAQLVGADGEAVGNPNQGPPTYGMSWIESDALNPFVLAEGVAPTAADHVVLDKGTADDAGVSVGDVVTVLSSRAPREMTVSGIARFGDLDSPAGANILSFTMATAQELVGLDGQFNEIVVDATDGVGQSELTATLGERIPTDTEAITGAAKTAEDQQSFQENLSFFSTFLLTFAVISLFVGSFIISNTFSIIVAQRSKELALMRAIGASRRQVMLSLVAEAVVVGVVASGIGLVLGIGVAAGLKALLAVVGIDIPASGTVITAGSMGIAFATGAVITVLAAVLPARRAAKVPPVAAMRDVALDTSATSKKRIATGVVLTGLGLLSLVGGLQGGGPAPVGMGAAVVFVGIAVLGPVIARPVARTLAAPLPALRGMTGTLARENASRNPKRTASTASALMIGVGLVVFITIFASSATSSLNGIIDDSVTGDLIVTGSGPLSPELAEGLGELPELDAVSAIRAASVRVDGSSTVLYAADAAVLPRIVDPQVVQGDFTALDVDGVAISSAAAEADGLSVGDQLTIDIQGEHTYTVDVVYENDTLIGDYVLDLSAFEAAVPNQLDMQVFTTIAEGVDPAAARAAVDAVLVSYPTAELNDMAEYKETQAAPFRQILNLIYALLLLAVIIALVGIANTLALSIHERTRELGLLRAVGMTRSQMRGAVRWESVIIALFGTTLGLGVGVFFGWALVQALASEGIDTFTVPVSQLSVIVALAALAGVVAGILPARRAARLNVLDAIAGE